MTTSLPSFLSSSEGLGIITGDSQTELYVIFAIFSFYCSLVSSAAALLLGSFKGRRYSTKSALGIIIEPGLPFSLWEVQRCVMAFG
jgi:hypothetical protein